MIGSSCKSGVSRFGYNGTEIDSCKMVCVSDFEKIIRQSHSIFFGGNPLDSVFSVFMAQFILIFIVSRTVYFVLRPLRQPKIVCNILAGVILGPSILGRHQNFLNTIFPRHEIIVLNTLSTLGAAFYTFIIAVKMDTTIVLRTAKNAWTIGLSSYFVPFIVIQIFNHIIKGQYNSGCLVDLGSFFLSSAFSTTYFPIVAHVMEELNLITTELGRLVMTSAILIEVFNHGVSIISVIVFNKNFISSIQTCIIVVTPILVLIYIIKPGIDHINRKTPEGKPVNDNYANGIMLGALVMTCMSDYAWGIFLPGAFLMGAIIPDGSSLGTTLAEKYELMIMEFFLPLFFVQLGYQIDIFAVNNLKAFFYTMLFIFVFYLAKLVGSMVASIHLNIRLEYAFLIGIILNFRGVFEFSVYQNLLTSQSVDEQCFIVLVLFSTFFTAFFSPLISLFYNPKERITNPNPSIKYLRTLQSIPLDSELHILTSIYDEDNVHGILNFLQAFHPTLLSPIYVDIIHAVELVGRTTPSLNSYNIYDKNIKYRTSQQIFRAFSNFSRNYDGLVSVHPFRMVAPYKTMDNIICNFAEDRQVPFIIVPLPLHKEKQLSDFNIRLQKNSPCSVGILLQKGSKARVNVLLDESCYNVAVLFIGGADDREALTLAMRMSRNQNVNISLLRISSAKSDEDKDKIDKNLDDALINEFIEGNLSNSSINYEEIVVNNSLEMVDVIKGLEANEYDLIMVGRNPKNLQFEKEMVEWIENPELGIIGDMLASWNDENYTKKLSILVVQSCKISSSFIIDLYKTKTIKRDQFQNVV